MGRLSLRWKMLIVVIMASTLCAAVSISGFLYFTKKERIEGILNKERTIHTQLSAATDFVAKQGGLKDSIEKYTGKYKSSKEITDVEKNDILSRVPIYASLVIGLKNSRIDNYDFRVFSDEPRQKDYQASPKELEIFNRFKNDPSLPEIVMNENGIVSLFRPVRLKEEQGCLMCHGSPSMSPWKDGTDILGFKMEDWSDGKLHGVFAVSQKIEDVAKASQGERLITPSQWLIVAILIGAFLAVLLAAYIVSAPINELTNLSKSLGSVSEEVIHFSDSLASSSQALSEASTEQAASLEETAASLEEISAMVSKATSNSQLTSQSSTESHLKAQEGRSAVSLMVKSMDDIRASQSDLMQQIDDNNDKMSDIAKVIHDIAGKTNVINEIVFQTKLLSFNASVEAARAGEHGKGFAVVAEEIGNLARMSGEASKEITAMLESSIVKVDHTVKNSQSNIQKFVAFGKEKVDTGMLHAKHCSSVLDDIVRNVEDVSKLAREISNASQEQAQGIAEINKAVAQLDTVTQQNAQTSETTAATAGDLSKQGRELKDAVASLLLTVNGSKD